MIPEIDVRMALADLEQAQLELGPALTAKATNEVTIRNARLWVEKAKRNLDEAITRATAEAMFGDALVIDGKNAETRKAQLDAYLLVDGEVIAARAQADTAAWALLEAEGAAELSEADARAALARVNSAQHASALLAAYYSLLAAPVADPVTETAEW